MKPLAPIFVVVVAVFAALLAAPWALGGQPYFISVLTLALVTAVPALGLNLLFGVAGLVSLGQMGLAGVGAYVAAALLKSGVAFVPALLAAALASAAAGLLIGLPCLRLRSHFFIIVTLAFGIILVALFNNLDDLTGGAAGLPGIPRPHPLDLGFAVLEFRRPVGFYWLALTVFAVAFLVQWLLVRSDFGRALAAIRQDEILAATRGVDVFAHKLAIFAISAAFAGVGGAMQVVMLRAAAPSSFDLMANIGLLMVVLVGGAGTLLGPLVGALVFVAAPEALRVAPSLRLVLFGAVLVVIALYAPRGLAGLAGSARRLRRA